MMPNKISFQVPTFVMLKNKRRKTPDKYQLNMNVYTSSHGLLIARAKKAFNLSLCLRLDFQHMAQYFQGKEKFKVTYTITAENKRKFDIANILAVVDKFTCDVLQNAGVIPDDSFNNLKEVVFRFGGITGKRICTVELESIDDPV